MSKQSSITLVPQSEFEREISIEFDKCKERIEASINTSPEDEVSNIPEGRKCFIIDKSIPVSEFQQRAGALKTPEEHRSEWKLAHAGDKPSKFAGSPVSWGSPVKPVSKKDRFKEKIPCCCVQ